MKSKTATAITAAVLAMGAIIAPVTAFAVEKAPGEQYAEALSLFTETLRMKPRGMSNQADWVWHYAKAAKVDPSEVSQRLLDIFHQVGRAGRPQRSQQGAPVRRRQI